MERALAHYDERLTLANTQHFMDVQNLASLLKRFELLGIDVGSRWEELAEHAEGRVDDHFLPFNDMHLCLSLAAAGRTDACERQLESLRSLRTSHDDAESASYPLEAMSVTIPVCEAIAAYHASDYAGVCDRLMPIRYDLAPKLL